MRPQSLPYSFFPIHYSVTAQAMYTELIPEPIKLQKKKIKANWMFKVPILENIEYSDVQRSLGSLDLTLASRNDFGVTVYTPLTARPF